MKKSDTTGIIELALVLIVSSAMFIYGFGKYFQFSNLAATQKPVSELTGMELMWVFYGYSRAFVFLLGLMEVTGGLLVLFRKTRIIGCLFVSGILLNIIVQDIIYEVNPGALVAAAFYQVSTFTILWINRGRLIEGVKILVRNDPKRNQKAGRIRIIILAIILACVLKLVEFIITH